MPLISDGDFRSRAVPLSSPMPFLIDGYNLLYAFQKSRWGSERVGRTLLCRLLGEWTQVERGRVTVVFDGQAPPPALSAQIADPRIEVSYSGVRKADESLADLINACSAPRRLTVVSSDREVQRAAAHRDARIVKSEAFCDRLARALKPTGSAPPGDAPIKTDGLNRSGCDEWLRQFGFDPSTEPPFEHP